MRATCDVRRATCDVRGITDTWELSGDIVIYVPAVDAAEARDAAAGIGSGGYEREELMGGDGAAGDGHRSGGR
eukprot:gene41492-26646_t